MPGCYVPGSHRSGKHTKSSPPHSPTRSINDLLQGDSKRREEKYAETRDRETMTQRNTPKHQHAEKQNKHYHAYNTNKSSFLGGGALVQQSGGVIKTFVKGIQSATYRATRSASFRLLSFLAVSPVTLLSRWFVPHLCHFWARCLAW